MKKRASIVLWIKWVIASFAGVAIGLMIALSAVSSLRSYFMSTLSEIYPLVALGAILLAVPAIAGTCLGLCQFLVLYKPIRLSALWIPATIAGCVVATVTILLIPIWRLESLPIINSMSNVFSGAIIGMAQWLVLRKSVSRAIWWIPITGLATFGALKGFGQSYQLFLYRSDFPQEWTVFTQTNSGILLWFPLLIGPTVYSLISASGVVILCRPFLHENS